MRAVARRATTDGARTMPGSSLWRRLRSTSVGAHRDQVVLDDRSNITGADDHERAGVSGRGHEFDLETVGFIHFHNRAEIAALEPMLREIEEVDPESTGWMFFGKWLRLEEEDEAAVLLDPVTLVRTIDRVFTGLVPPWRALHEIG